MSITNGIADRDGGRVLAWLAAAFVLGIASTVFVVWLANKTPAAIEAGVVTPAPSQTVDNTPPPTKKVNRFAIKKIAPQASNTPPEVYFTPEPTPQSAPKESGETVEELNIRLQKMNQQLMKGLL